MKKYTLLISLLISIVCYSFEYASASLPTVEFTSVNNFQTITNRQYSISPVGATTPICSNVYQRTITGPQRVSQDPNEPFTTPIGDFPIYLLVILAIGYMIMVKIRLQTRIFENKV